MVIIIAQQAWRVASVTLEAEGLSTELVPVGAGGRLA